VLTAVATLGLIWVGGLVTSRGAGMAVPDWPTTYGYNLFYFPVSQWVGGVFYEHTHRLWAAGVGLLTSLLAAWIWGRQTRGRARWLGWAFIAILVGLLSHRGSGQAEGGINAVPLHFRALVWVLPPLLVGSVAQCVRHRGALEWLALTAFVGVILQGLMGGLRVAAMRPELGILHGLLAQLFFILLCVIALRTSTWWQRATDKLAVYAAGRLRYVFVTVTALILGQLVLGATMRHQHAGLAIPDFPTAYGGWWPATDPASIARYNQARVELTAANPITAFQIHLQLTHRALAVLIFLAVAWTAGAARSRLGLASPVTRWAAVWFAAILLQVILGAATIWTNKAADIATAHVLVGALSLAIGSLISVITCRAASRMTVPSQATASRSMLPVAEFSS